MNAFDLLALTEAANGFQGGAAVDTLPHLSLTEATAELPVAILREQVDLHVNTMKENDSLTEAAISAITSGTSFDAGPLVEASFDGIINKIKAFFAKIKKFLSSIVAKITLQIDKIRMTGKQLYAKYKNSDMLKNKSFEGLTVNGYKFDGNVPFASAEGFLSDVFGLLNKAGDKVMTPGEFRAKCNAVSDGKYDAVKSELDAMKEIDSSEQKCNFAKALTGVDVGDDWAGDIKKELYGDKADLVFGEDFTYASVTGLLEKGAGLDAIKNGYAKLRKEVDNNEKAVTKAADELKKEIKTTGKVGEDAPKNLSIASDYYTAYLGIYQNLTAVITKVQDIRCSYEMDKYNQAKVIFGKMLSYKGKKADESFDVDTEDFDFDL